MKGIVRAWKHKKEASTVLNADQLKPKRSVEGSFRAVKIQVYLMHLDFFMDVSQALNIIND
ncbi:hypothetical protein L3V36_14060, partial [Vibrio sp. G-C-1]|uniref:hypothetical protein n=1 Tax=Vibrio sp. G-C-1 TaxID=2912255 RepID=UPI001F228523